MEKFTKNGSLNEVMVYFLSDKRLSKTRGLGWNGQPHSPQSHEASESLLSVASSFCL
jgi:hypothetical protein